MDVKTWTTISRLLDDALDLPPGARSAWLDGLSSDYDALKPQLRVLLAQAASMDAASFLATLPKFAPPGDGPAASADAHQGSRIGAAVGPYRLVRLVASGGQGSVWLAERPDGLLNRPVAIKLPHGLAFRPGLAERMARERDILASLSHPHIARLYDAGVSAEGEPYLALEYVEGMAIDAHASARRLPVEARVRLMLQVVRAVAYAHGQLVIHRDLKPSNVLVTTEGHVRLLDFGIAKLLGDEPVDSTLTAESGRAMTLAYASPEQVQQQPLGVATDVYSLGVVLFELLTGTRPYAVARESAAALEDAILSAEPRRASEAAAAKGTRRALAGDLDTILAKALKKAPSDRYDSAQSLANDLERYLDGRPVLAQPDSRAYRLRKFVARHRVGLAASVALAAAVIAGFIGTATGLVRARQAEADARASAEDSRRQAQTSDRVARFLVDLFDAAKPEEQDGAEVTARQMLDRGAEKIRTQLDDEPLVKARMLRTVSDAYSSLARYPNAATLADEAITVARAAGPAGERELVKALTAYAVTHRRLEDVAGAERALREAMATTQRIDPNDLDTLARIYNELALLVRVRDPEEALRLYRQTYDIIVKLQGAEHGDAGVLLLNIGANHARQRRWHESRQFYEQALPILTKHFGEADPRLGALFGNLAIVEKELGNLTRALDLSRRDLEVTTRAYGLDHPAAGRARTNYARTALVAGDDPLALEQIELAVAIDRRHFPPHHGSTITGTNTLALLLARAGRTHDARALLTQLVRLPAESSEAQSAQLVSSLQLAEIERRSARYDEAVGLVRGVLEHPIATKDGKIAVDASWAMACVLATKGDRDAAAQWRQRSLDRQAADVQALPFNRLVAQARYAACGADPAGSVRLLREAVSAGLRDRSVLGDPAFAAVRAEPGFVDVAKSLTSADAGAVSGREANASR